MTDDDQIEAETLIVATPDLQGRLIGRRVPRNRIGTIWSEGVAISNCVFGWDIAQDPELLTTEALPYTGVHTGIGDCLLMPDRSTLRRAGWLNDTVIALADVVEVDGTPTDVSPRHILREQIAALEALGFSASVGAELEYYLFHGLPGELLADDYRELSPKTCRPGDFVIAAGDPLEPELADLRTKLLASRIAVEASQVEWGLGQLETTLVHADPLEMADQSALYKLAVRTHAAQRNSTASFMAKPRDGQPGSSCHLHLSLRHNDGQPAFWDESADHAMSAILRHAIGGALTHAPELMAWYAPTVNSYRRIRGTDAAGWGQTWGIDHRFVSVRVVGHTPESIRLEFRLSGADANAYLAIAALLGSVRDGIENELDPGPPVLGSPFTTSASSIPQHLGEAVDAFASSDWARETFGEDVISHHATVLAFEWSQFLDSVTDWERRRYFDTV